MGELTMGTHPILAKDVHIATNKHKLLFVLHSSKTHGKNDKPQKIKITGLPKSVTNQKILTRLDSMETQRKSHSFCPFTILKRYLTMRLGYKSLKEQFFVFRDGSPVKSDHFRSILRSSLKNVGLLAELYNSHSFRIGRSCDLYNMGVPISTIQKLGCWSSKSSTVYTYLKDV